MVKYLFPVALALIFLSLAGISFFVGVPRVHKTELPAPQAPHFYNNSGRSIEHIEVAVFYFVPADARDSQTANWRELLETNLQKLKEFHEYQFLGRSQLSFRVHPVPVQGRKNSSEYEGIRDVAVELEHLASSTSLLVVMYEGPHEATGVEGTKALIARSLLSDKAYAPFHATFLAHEFYHTLGVPDRYTPSARVFAEGGQDQVGIISSGDVMGRIRVPLEQTYLSSEVLIAMGL